MINKKVILSNKLGLHTRAASQLVDCASRYLSQIQVECNGRQADAKRILEVMLLGAKAGLEIEIRVSGDDEVEALEAISRLIMRRFGEES